VASDLRDANQRQLPNAIFVPTDGSSCRLLNDSFSTSRNGQTAYFLMVAIFIFAAAEGCGVTGLMQMPQKFAWGTGSNPRSYRTIAEPKGTRSTLPIGLDPAN
jgi:hypothetical protein